MTFEQSVTHQQVEGGLPEGSYRGLKSDELIRSTLIGVAAGLSASWIMNQFQALFAKSSDNDPGSADDKSKPTTVKTADMISKAATGEEVPKRFEWAADATVHYGFGAFLGGLYGALGVTIPGVRAGFGTAYGAGVALVADEAMVPALGLTPPPQEVPVRTHAYGLVSHLVFGVALEASRRIILQVSQKRPAEIGVWDQQHSAAV